MIFETDIIVSASTDRLLCEMDEIYKILNFLTGDNLFTHQLPRAMRKCKEHLETQLPWLRTLDTTEDRTMEAWNAWLLEIELTHGKEHDIQPLPPGTWFHINPVLEAEHMMGEGKVIALTIPKPSG